VVWGGKIKKEEGYYSQLSPETVIENPNLLREFVADEDIEVKILVFEVILETYNELLEGLRDELINILVHRDYDDISMRVSKIMVEKYEILPGKLREGILEELANDGCDAVRSNTVDIINENFNEISTDLREGLLIRFKEDSNKYVRSKARMATNPLYV